MINNEDSNILGKYELGVDEKLNIFLFGLTGGRKV
jgi:hypothetical protein